MGEGICRECGDDLDDNCQCSACELTAREEYTEQLRSKDAAWRESNKEIERLKAQLENDTKTINIFADSEKKAKARAEVLEENLNRHVESMTKMIGQRDIYTPAGIDRMLKIRAELRSLLKA
jgi:hypothetical protein